MAFRHGTTARIHWRYLRMSGYASEIDIGFERDMAEAAVLTDTWKTHKGGLKFCVLSIQGAYHPGGARPTDGYPWASMAQTAATRNVFAYLPDGDTLGNVAYMGRDRASAFSVPSNPNDVIRVPIATIGSEDCTRGVVLHVFGAETSDDEETSVDGSSSSADGGYAYIMCELLTGAANVTVKIEHSADDVSYSDLLTFAVLTGSGDQVATIAAGADSIKRYTKVSWVFGTPTTPSATFYVGLTRT